jgi:hypothetical protein
MSPHFKEILSIFNDHEVKYLIVGAYAVMKSSEPRYTRDLDIWVEASEENSKQVYSSLRMFGAPVGDLSEADFAADGFFQMGRPPVRIDILMSIDGVEFAHAWPNRQEGNFVGIPAHFISSADLIANKSATGRPQDFVDIESLRNCRLTEES